MRVLKKEMWPVKVKIHLIYDDPGHDDIYRWLEETLGPQREKWVQIVGYRTVDYYFRNDKDANWFALRWA